MPVLPEPLNGAEFELEGNVVAGHKRVGAPDGPERIGASQRYLRDFSRIVSEGGTVKEIVAGMLKLHGDRDNPRTLWHSARTAVAKRG